MASIFMRIDGVKPEGGATVESINGKDGFFAIETVSWGAVRGVGIDVGNANNMDQGMVALGEVALNRECDGASPYLTTFLYVPTSEGKLVEVLLTKPERNGNGADPYLIISLKEARISNYEMSVSNGSLPQESFNLIYTEISKSYYIEGQNGEIKKGPEVAFNTTTAKVISAAK